LYALVSVYMIAITPIVVFSPVIAKYAAEFHTLHDEGHTRGLLGRLVVVFGGLAAVYALVGFVYPDPIAAYLHVGRWEVAIVGLCAAVAILSAAARGVAQGLHAFRTYSVSVAGEGIARIAFLLLLVPLLTPLTAMIAFGLGLLAGAIAVTMPLIARFRGVSPLPFTADLRRVFQAVAASGSLAVAMSFIGFIDVVIVKNAFGESQSGLYSAAAWCGKLVLYLVSFLPPVLIPLVTRRHALGDGTRATLWAALIFIGVISSSGVVALQFFGSNVLHVLVGAGYDGAASMLPKYAAAMALLSATNTIGSYGLATNRVSFALPLFSATLLVIIALFCYHPSLAAVIDVLVAGNVLMILSTAAPLAWEGSKK
jgi:O-antigen/teichoic acid export membrane protein